ncbi:MAG: exosortase C-terminal domain/associated protein EpsI [Bryobacteraceae bacterium]
MTDTRMILVPVFLLAQALLVYRIAGAERPPQPPALATFPFTFDTWRQLREDPIAADVAAELRADQILSRTYLDQSTGSTANLFVAWFQSQRSGASQPHSPKVCLPASGWTPSFTGETTITTSRGAITVNRYIVVNRSERDVILYWYQGPHRVTAGEWEAKLWSIVDGIRNQRTDTALVRVVVQASPAGDQAATAVATGFVRRLYPLLRETLPSY